MATGLEEQLRSYFDEAKIDRGDIRIAVSRLADQVNLLSDKLHETQVEIVNRVAGIEARVTWLEKSSENTGSFMRMQVERKDSDARFLKREGTRLVLEIVKWFVVVVGSAGVGHLILKAVGQ